MLNNPYKEIIKLFFPLSLILPVIFISLIILTLYISTRNAKYYKLKAFKFIFAVNYIIIGFNLLIVSFFLNPLFNLPGVLTASIISISLLIDLKYEKTIISSFDSKSISIISIILMISGMVLYPIIQLLTGGFWKYLIYFGFGKCPTTIFLIGFLIFSLPKTNKFLLGFTSLMGIVVGFFMIFIGFYADILYLIAGITGLFFLIRYWNNG